jgi:hypothetical protein
MTKIEIGSTYKLGNNPFNMTRYTVVAIKNGYCRYRRRMLGSNVGEVMGSLSVNIAERMWKKVKSR